MIIDWQSKYESVIRTIGNATYGQERWFYEDNGTWYDRKEGDYIDFFTLERRIYEAVETE